MLSYQKVWNLPVNSGWEPIGLIDTDGSGLTRLVWYSGLVRKSVYRSRGKKPEVS